MKKIIRIFDVIFAVFCAIVFAFVIYGRLALPDSYTLYNSGDLQMSSVYSVAEQNGEVPVDYKSGVPVNRKLRLGIIPVKTVSVALKEERRVFVSGETFGIKLYTDGVIVVGTQAVETASRRVNPATEAGIEVGDIIVSINNINVFSSDEVSAILNENNGDSYRIKLKRNGRYKTFVLTPAYSEREGCYKAGMWVRDSTAGIGTLTYFDKKTGTFGALGHQVNDVDTNDIMPLLEGEAVSARVTKIQKAAPGTTGSLACDFESNTMGSLLLNSANGLYGSYSYISENAFEISVAPPQTVHKGKAQLLCEIDEGKPRMYDIEIIAVSFNRREEQKDIVFKIKDKELLNKTGGIVQGMSGSPVIQDNRLIGAVTHVIVNNPEKGYAVFAQSMLEKSDELVK